MLLAKEAAFGTREAQTKMDKATPTRVILHHLHSCTMDIPKAIPFKLDHNLSVFINGVTTLNYEFVLFIAQSDD